MYVAKQVFSLDGAQAEYEESATVKFGGSWLWMPHVAGDCAGQAEGRLWTGTGMIWDWVLRPLMLAVVDKQ